MLPPQIRWSYCVLMDLSSCTFFKSSPPEVHYTLCHVTPRIQLTTPYILAWLNIYFKIHTPVVIMTCYPQNQGWRCVLMDIWSCNFVKISTPLIQLTTLGIHGCLIMNAPGFRKSLFLRYIMTCYPHRSSWPRCVSRCRWAPPWPCSASSRPRCTSWSSSQRRTSASWLWTQPPTRSLWAAASPCSLVTMVMWLFCLLCLNGAWWI